MATRHCRVCALRPAVARGKSGKCLECLNEYQRGWRARKKATRLCDGCPDPAAEGKSQCDACRARTAEEARASRAGRKASGKCTKCGKRPPISARRSICPVCKKAEDKCKAAYVAAGKCSCGREPPESGGVKCRLCLASMRKNRSRWRRKAITAYGGKCNCCGESTPEFLQLDHKNNDGASHRREIGKGTNIYLWAKENGYPDILQVLCANCHNALSCYGYCPHHPGKETRRVSRRRRGS